MTGDARFAVHADRDGVMVYDRRDDRIVALLSPDLADASWWAERIRRAAVAAARREADAQARATGYGPSFH
jgi:hypothetical protein